MMLRRVRMTTIGTQRKTVAEYISKYKARQVPPTQKNQLYWAVASIAELRHDFVSTLKRV